MTAPLPTFPWFDVVPEGLLTRKQLAGRGLRPGGPVRGRVVWRQGRREALLFALDEAQAKRVLTSRQAEVLAAHRQAQAAKRQAIEEARERIRQQQWEEREAHRAAHIAADRLRAIEEARRLLALGAGGVIVDTETTDIDGFMIELCVLALDGSVLLESYVQPNAPISEGATDRHGIKAEQLAGQPCFVDLLPRLAETLNERTIVAYNAPFDRGIFVNEIARVFPTKEERAVAFEKAPWMRLRGWQCAMELYAEFVGEWSDYHGNYRWQPLPGAVHGAVGDCRAVLELLRDMAAAGAGDATT